MTRHRILAALVPLAMLAGLAVAATPARVAAAGTNLYADLYGDEVVPGPGSPDAEAFAYLTLDPTAGTLCWDLKMAVDSPTGAELHAGAFGDQGPMVATLTEPLDSGCLDGQDPAVLQAMIDGPDAYYLQVTSTDFPDGAVRGQLYAQPPQPVTLYASLSGADVVPGPGDPAIAGYVQLDVEPTGGSVCAYWDAIGIDSATGAELRVGVAGASGELVASLPAPGQSGEATDPCVSGVDSAALQGIVDDPTGYYLDVISPDYPDGAARGQLTTEAPPPPPPPPCGPPDVCGGTLLPGTYTWYGFAHPMSFTLDTAWESSLPDGNLALDPPDASAVIFFSFSGELSHGSCDYALIPTSSGVLDFGSDGTTPNPILSLYWDDYTVSLPDDCPSMVLFPGSGAVDGGGTGTTGSPMALDDAGGFTVVNGDKVRFITWHVDDEVIVAMVDNFAGEIMDTGGDPSSSLAVNVTWGPIATPVEAGGSEDGGGVADTALPARPPQLPIAALLLSGVIGLSVGRLRWGRRPS